MSAKSTKPKSLASGPGAKLIASNRRARHDYEILDTFEAGLVLEGSEVKSLRAGQCQLADGFVRFDGGEAWLYKVHIPQYAFAGASTGHDPERRRKLLLHRAEIDRLGARVAQDKLAVVPLAMYFLEGRAKCEIGLAKGKTKGDRRQAIAQRDADLEARRAMRDRQRTSD